jgi:hypothetical protein
MPSLRHAEVSGITEHAEVMISGEGLRRTLAEKKHEAAEQLITTTACAIVALLTLTPPGN